MEGDVSGMDSHPFLMPYQCIVYYLSKAKSKLWRAHRPTDGPSSTWYRWFWSCPQSLAQLCLCGSEGFIMGCSRYRYVSFVVFSVLVIYRTSPHIGPLESEPDTPAGQTGRSLLLMKHAQAHCVRMNSWKRHVCQRWGLRAPSWSWSRQAWQLCPVSAARARAALFAHPRYCCPFGWAFKSVIPPTLGPTVPRR